MGWLSSTPSFEGYTPPKANTDNIDALKNKALKNMIFFGGGDFKFGNVPVPVILDGETRNELIYGPLVDPDRAPITLGGFYMAAFEITNHDFDLYAAANDLPLRPDRANSHERQGPYPAAIAYHQAEAYCAWLAELTDQPFVLPTQHQWEYAARSGGHSVAYATQDGAYDYLEDLYNATLDGQPHTTHLPDAYPPNPAGIYAMSSNLSEWVHDVWHDPESGEQYPQGFKGDPEAAHRRGWRGASHARQAELGSVYTVGAAGPIERTRRLESFAQDAPYFEPDIDVAYFAYNIGARCAVALDAPPDTSGFGTLAPSPPAGFPTPFKPLPRR